MANTVMTAKNTFAEGLVMDFAPDNTQAMTLTSALNATLLTFNGNEMSLQNDMGNGRVETAYLPDGYVPVGTCEFGDIIYIVSYNPITNKSQIGCFPSPERNISSEEISDLSQSISSAEFQEFKDGLPTGKLMATSVKKLLFDNKSLNPGDKYVIYSNSDSLSQNSSKLTDYGNESHEYGTWPRLAKIHVISIEDSGKISYLDSTLKWYDDVHYYLNDLQETQKGTPDLDSYRSLVTSAYSIFQSKNSGQLAVLVELEQIDSFNCAYSVTSGEVAAIDDGDLKYQSYNIYLHASWNTKNNDINPCGLAILSSEWVGTDGGKYRIATKQGNNYVYGSLQGPIELPISSPGYDIKVELGRIYYPENNNTNYQTYIGNQGVEPKNRVISESHDTSYNYFITSDHTNYNVGWPKDVNGILRDVTRITQAKTDTGEYIINTYYFNLDGFEIDSKGNKIAKTRGISNELYSSGEYDNSGGTGRVILSPDVVNNYFKKDVTIKLLDNIHLPLFSYINDKEVEIDNSNFIWKIKVAPCMPYGVLEQYAIDLIIDFSKVGRNTTDLTQWRYWNQGEVCTLTYGMDINLSSNKKVKEVTFDFYDNQGVVATYRSSEKESYSGIFTEQFGLGGNNTNYKLGVIDSEGKPIYHAGQSYTGELSDNLVYWDGVNKPIQATSEHDTSKIYLNDAGSLYPNFLYKVDIKITYGVVDELGNFVDGTLQQNHYSRWLWMNSMYNDYYYTTPDFDILPLQLDLGYSYNIRSNPNYSLKQDLYYNNAMSAENENIPLNSLGATVTHINQDGQQDGNINISLQVGLGESYQTLYFIESEGNKLQTQIRLGQSYISTEEISIISEYNNVRYDFLFPQLDDNIKNSNGKLDNTLIGKVLKEYLYGEEQSSGGNELWESADAYKNYKDTFNIAFSDKYLNQVEDEEFKYTDPKTENDLTTYKKLELSGDYMINQGVDITLTGISFTKQCFNSNEPYSGTYPKVEPIIRSQSNRDRLNLAWDPDLSTFYFRRVLGFTTAAGDKSQGGICWRQYSSASQSSVTENPEEMGSKSNITYNSSRLLTALRNKDVTSPLVLICWSRWKKSQRFYTDGASISALSGGDNKQTMPNLDGGDSSKKALFQLALNKLDSSFYLLNDAFGKSNDRGEAITQVPSAGSRYTQANMVASMLAQIYYQTPTSQTYEGYKFSNLCYPQDYSEIWGKHILITLKVKSEVQKQNELVAFANGFRFSAYLEAVETKFPEASQFLKIASNNNVQVQLQPTTQVIDFQYNIPSTEELKNTYKNMVAQIASLIYLADSTVAIPSSQTYANSLYYLDKSNNLVPLTKQFSYRLCNWSWAQEVDASDLIVSSYDSTVRTLDTLGQLIKYNADQIFEVRRYPTKNLYMIGTGEDKSDRNWYTGASKDAEFTQYWKKIS